MGPGSDRNGRGDGLGRNGEHLSIVVPTFNCARWLGETLRSLQAQGSRLDEAEIVVLDDCSTTDDPEAVVREVWGDRVAFERHPANVGPTRNFNACLARAGREWIHILHGDDYVFAGAYDEFDAGIRAVPDATAVFARTVYVDAEGVWLGLSERLGHEPRGRLSYVPTMWAGCVVQFAGVLVSKRGVAEVGNFNEHFSHAADYNLWWRFARQSRVAYTNACVGAYRHFHGNHTSTLRRTARNLQEHVEQVRNVEQAMRADGSWTAAARRALYGPIMVRALRQAREYLGDAAAFEAHDRLLSVLPLTPRSQARRAELRLRRWANSALPKPDDAV